MPKKKLSKCNVPGMFVPCVKKNRKSPHLSASTFTLVLLINSTWGFRKPSAELPKGCTASWAQQNHENPSNSAGDLFGVKTWPFRKVIRDLQRSGIKRVTAWITWIINPSKCLGIKEIRWCGITKFEKRDTSRVKSSILRNLWQDPLKRTPFNLRI